MTGSRSIWRTHGVRILGSPMQRVEASNIDGVSDATAITFARTGAKEISGGAVHVDPGVTTAPHHHGESETVIVVMKGDVRFRWGENLQYAADGTGGDFIFVPPFVPHQEINLSNEEPLEYVTIHTGKEKIHVDLEIEPSQEFEHVSWDDPNHPVLRAGMLRGAMFSR